MILQNYASGVRTIASPELFAAIAALGDWCSVEAVAEAIGYSDPRRLSRLLASLFKRSFLHRSDRPIPANERALSGWREWHPEAAFFHLSTRNVRFISQRQGDAVLRRKAAVASPPAPLKRVHAAKRIELPLINPNNELAQVLRERRTWRRFDSKGLDLSELSVLLGLTWGVQRWLVIPGQGKLALKTSPSPGARHNLESYVLVRRVNGLRQGLYHYDPDRHALARLPGMRRPRISDYLPHQTWYDGSAALVLMTAVFERAQWRYNSPAAYRSILIEAGHFGQTFCLLATSLGLAPFSSRAFADSVIERDLGIDGVREAAIYACGVGRRPPGTDWAPWPEGFAPPRTVPPKYASSAARSRSRRDGNTRQRGR